MARILPQSVFRRGFDHQSWGADRRTAGSDQWLAPEGVKAAVAITDTVGGVVSSAVQKKMGRDKILDQLSMGKEKPKPIRRVQRFLNFRSVCLLREKSSQGLVPMDHGDQNLKAL